MHLSKATFSTVIESTPLVSIDLITVNELGQILLGKRLNKPAQNYWFVPGGRVHKGETLESAFERLTMTELGKQYSLNHTQIQGAYTHLYDDHVYGDDFGTHYVALAYRLVVTQTDLSLPLQEQHGSYHWFEETDLLKSPDVHFYTKCYFQR
ncbi:MULTISPECIES: GDP-mannose mannosyl hydrolase [Vibrio]|uniref:GDP-mannose mannosyl hydrolase n=1 Tax=Vibrio TaxID=662 RepID=UPI000C2AFEEB|nr:GDP-mannose mannosyl hydrolase [Vibrio salilacus]